MVGTKEAQASFTPSIGDSLVLNPALDDSKYEIEDLNVTPEIIKHPEMQQETPQKVAKKEALDSPDSGKVRHDHPNLIPLASWASETIEAETLIVHTKATESLVKEKK